MLMVAQIDLCSLYPCQFSTNLFLFFYYRYFDRSQACHLVHHRQNYSLQQKLFKFCDPFIDWYIELFKQLCLAQNGFKYILMRILEWSYFLEIIFE